MSTIEKLVFEALIKEVELTPKPGLVDKENNGAHVDMDIQTFYKSAHAIKPFALIFFEVGTQNKELKYLFEELRRVGKLCEDAMFAATQGINTHKGMVFSLAVILGAMGKLQTSPFSLTYQNLQTMIKKICKDLVQKDFGLLHHAMTHGEQFYHDTKKSGIRGEAQNGYPTIFHQSLPFFLEKQQHYGDDIALKMTLLFIMSQSEDSNLFARGGLAGLTFVQHKSQQCLKNTKISDLDTALRRLDQEFTAKNLSPGGSADLLCLTWLIARLEVVF
ncbi:triphosphoribosyl-dephospho-CoA synthase CitG [Sulfurospirillum sp. 1612]|uniref:triphosphoribosyl-dephospho-CoA synthase CitG n=1 Tax=Sulfurospirillum sp. 1612 TaxID=3094835 RepID=UPI002F932F54